MEKSTCHCKLEVVRAFIEGGRVRATFVAVQGADALGLDLEGMVQVVTALTPLDFYKSMTSHSDHTIWQDVYRPRTPVGEIYLKLTVVDDVLIVSFKEL
ncbi:MAG: mRNA interferase MqsR [Rhizobacter sp.]|nr:mRNA interferase MqsR [Rhizobacter sp.]